MSRISSLPIYKETFDLFKLMMRVVKNMPRDYRRLAGEEMTTACMSMITLIHKANFTRDMEVRKMRLLEFEEELQMLRVLCRLSEEMRFMSKKNYANIIETLEGIAKQQKGWLKYTSKVSEGGS